MIYVFAVAGVMIWVIGVGWLCLIDRMWAYALAFVIFVVPIGMAVQSVVEYDKKFPCVQYETRLQYNVATKTTMPMRVCVLRGEWLD